MIAALAKKVYSFVSGRRLGSFREAAVRTIMRVRLLSAALLWGMLGLSAKAAEPVGTDWPWFLGPDHTGVSTETGLLATWPKDGPPLLWERDVGTGYSAPSVRGERLVLHHRIDDAEIVECCHALTGQTIWTYRYSSDFSDPYGYNNGPRCSPILTESHCYTLGAQGKLLCLTLDKGELVWQHDLRDDYTIPDGFFGVGATPVLEGDRLIVLVGGQPDAGVVAFAAKDGGVLWKAVGKSTWDGVADEEGEVYRWTGDEMVVSYSSPIVATIHGHRHVLCLMRQGLVSLDPRTGRERFKYWFRPTVHESVNAACPVVVDDTILLTAAYRQGSALLKVQPDGNRYEVVWRDRRNLLAHWSTPIALDGHFYGFSGRHEQEGELRCVRASDGEVVWSTDGWGQPLTGLAQNPATGAIVDRATGVEIPWPFYGRGSKILADGKFIVLGERGTLALVQPSPEGWRELSRCKAPRMHNPSWTAPVLSQGRLYLRCEDALVCLHLRANTGAD
ncbi:MAG: PQQ-binding-like beta-propeller repeat protein [Planctomycetaceae bacterium]